MSTSHIKTIVSAATPVVGMVIAMQQQSSDGVPIPVTLKIFLGVAVMILIMAIARTPAMRPVFDRMGISRGDREIRGRIDPEAGRRVADEILSQGSTGSTRPNRP